MLQNPYTSERREEEKMCREYIKLTEEKILISA